MYPILFTVFGFPVTSYGVMLVVGLLVGNWLTVVRWRELRLDPAAATNIFTYVMVGGLVGAKLYYAVDTWLREGTSLAEGLVSDAGITWYGGMIGGAALAAIGCRVHGVSFRLYADTACVGAAVGEALGRVGCFLVGDDYGRATDLPWGIAFPEGYPPTLDLVHPTQLYHVAWLLPIAAFLWRRRRTSPFLFGEYLALNGAGRIVVEHWRVNPRVALGLTEPQWIGIALIALGVSGWLACSREGGKRALT